MNDMLWSRVAAGLVLTLASCSSSDDDTSSGGGADGGPIITCESGSDVYVANLEKSGRSGALRFVLKESNPAPPSRGRNTWTLRILDGAGNPVSGAQIVVDATMPAHGHSSPTVPTIKAEADTYVIGPISLFMPGLWQVTIDATAGGSKDTALFSFCVAG